MSLSSGSPNQAEQTWQELLDVASLMWMLVRYSGRVTDHWHCFVQLSNGVVSSKSIESAPEALLIARAGLDGHVQINV